MKLQFAFGANPSAKKTKKGKKKVAGSRKKAKTNKVKSKNAGKGTSMAKRKKTHRRKSSHKKRRNPEHKDLTLERWAASQKKVYAGTKTPHNVEEVMAAGGKAFGGLSKRISAAKKRKARAAKKAREMAKKKHASKKKPHKKVKKHVSKKKAGGKKRGGHKRKTSRRKKHSRSLTHSHSSKVKHIKKGQKVHIGGHAGKGASRIGLSGTLKFNPKKKRRARRHKHTHKSSSRVKHLRKGTSIRVHGSVGKGKKKVKLSGRVKVNPRHHSRRNPMKQVTDMTKKYLGMNGEELTALAVGGALVPVINGLTKKLAPQVVGLLNTYVGSQAAGSVLPILMGAGLNALAEHALPAGPARDYTKVAGEGLASAGIVGLMLSISQNYIIPATGLGAVIYGPGYSGINYTPNMQGINYTPNMGVTPQLGAGYTEAHKYSRADFGRGADFGGMSGADFGEYALDQDVDEQMDPDQIMDSSMSGGMS
jgi:general stress protein 26